MSEPSTLTIYRPFDTEPSRKSFTAPASGRVLLRYSAWIRANRYSTGVLAPEIRTATGVIVLAASDGTGVSHTGSASWSKRQQELSDLEPGVEYVAQLMRRSLNAVGYFDPRIDVVPLP